jgi:hypothetical protein
MAGVASDGALRLRSQGRVPNSKGALPAVLRNNHYASLVAAGPKADMVHTATTATEAALNA